MSGLETEFSWEESPESADDALERTQIILENTREWIEDNQERVVDLVNRIAKEGPDQVAKENLSYGDRVLVLTLAANMVWMSVSASDFWDLSDE